MGWQGELQPRAASPGAQHHPRFILSSSRCCSEGGIAAGRKVLGLFLSLCGGISAAGPPISAGRAQGTRGSRLIQPRDAVMAMAFMLQQRQERIWLFSASKEHLLHLCGKHVAIFKQ